MGFRRSMGWLIMVSLFVLLWGNIAAGSEGRRDPEITVLVQDSAGISGAVLNEAELEAARIFRAAGIAIAWLDCSTGSAGVDDACHGVPGFRQFVLHIVSKGKTSSDLVFGVAFLGQDGTGKYSDVFFDRVEQAQGKFCTNRTRLLGTVAAHELGHLLLGSHAHSHAGVMTPVWKDQTLRRMEMGSLLFTREQASLMRARIRGGDELSSIEGSGRK